MMLVKETVMKETLWGNLPSEILERVLAFLPVDSLIRMRCVQRRWNELIANSHSFAKHHANFSPHSPWFMLFTRQMSCFLAYDINCNKWHRVSVPGTPFLPNQLPLSTDSGLVCYRRRFVAHKRQQQEPIELLVCNPLTGSSRQLPSLNALKIEVLGMVCGLEADGAAYRIFTVANVSTLVGGSCDYKVILYDSVTNQWTTECSFQSDETWVPRPAIWFQGSFCFLSQSETFYTLQFYDMQQRMWIEHATKREQFFFHNDPFLMECQGRLFIVGDTLQICFQILELVEEEAKAEETHRSRKWVKFDVMPRSLYLDYFENMNVIVAGNGNFIFFQTQGCERTLMYNISHKSWQWTSDSGVVSQGSPYTGLMFQPRIGAVA
ncbi:unnamed protein product [Sphagnum compactum]